MASPTRFTGGVTTASKSTALGQYGAPDPTKWHAYFNDFDTYAAGDWTITAVGTGTSALTDIDGGALLVTNSAADNDGRQHQLVGEGFLLASGKKSVFKARFKISDATQSDLIIGLCVLDTTLLGATAGDGVTDGIFFQKDDGSTTLTAYCQKNTTTGQTSATATTLADDTFLTVGWYYNGVDSVAVYVNDAQVATLDGTSTYLPDTELSVSFGTLNGEAVAKVLTLDYIFAAKER